MRELRTHEADVTAVVSLPIFRNEHLSVSRLRRFEQCPLAFSLQYVNKPDKGLEAPDREAADFGNVLHDALERTYRWILDEEYEGPFPEVQLLESFRLAWSDGGLVGVTLYQEGRDILRRYAGIVGFVDHMRVLAVEQEFNLLVGPNVCRLVDPSEKSQWMHVDDHFVINGFIDRVDRVDAQTVEVVDYKSNRLLFAREELASDLQMSIYSLAARELFPWATDIRLAFHMLRHDLRQVTERTADDLAVAREYVRALGTRTEKGPYEPRLNTNCGTCDHRARCDTYKAAVERKLEVVAVSDSDIETLARERERVASIAKAAYSRKDHLDAILRAAVERSGQDSLELGGVVYRIAQYFNTEYPAEELVRMFEAIGVNLSSALRIDNEALDAVLKVVEKDERLPRTVRDFLRVRVAAKSVKLPQKPRLDARPKKKR